MTRFLLLVASLLTFAAADFANDALTAHNNYRFKHRAPALTLSSSVNESFDNYSFKNMKFSCLYKVERHSAKVCAEISRHQHIPAQRNCRTWRKSLRQLRIGR